ncbi:hypothetical protein BP6252_03326 [Coleophoma cylindrospora]|uniref:Zn(2)-C6 fungal-type domain-containing protein n=1 Tax=Coleophoma cylindrospora TaxID=1849047 RepID=A0A3D8S813_9HELO|nr:hypothetical protein BP6252_03326 [Coleophoma cylindrospora]
MAEPQALSERDPSLRRNGKKKSCEPCRKGKLRCDHATPFCGRCVRRKQTTKCIYHPAPMTKPKGLPAPAPAPTPQPTPSLASGSTGVYCRQKSPAPAERPRHELGGLFKPTPNNRRSNLITLPNGDIDRAPLRGDCPPPGPTDDPCARRHRIWKESRFRRSRRYYGPTSFTAVFSEGQDEFPGKLLNIAEDERVHPARWPFDTQPLWGRRRPGAPGVRINETVKALYNIPSKVICERLLVTFDSFYNCTMNEVMIRHAISTLWSTFGDELKEPRAPEKLATIVEVFLENEETPILDPPTDGMEWLNTFLGAKLRFESLGLLFTFLGMAYHSLQDDDPVFRDPSNNGRDRKQTAWRMVECADLCLKMCDCTDTVNEIVVALLLNLLILESNCAGDECWKLRRRHGDMVTAATTIGLHRLPDNNIEGPTAAGEYSRRLFVAVYRMDKFHSSLNGTPPLLCRLYCNFQLPLELSDEEMFLPHAQLIECVSKLDMDGWKTPPSFMPISWHRALLLLSTIREEVLAFTLGVDIDVTASRIEDLQRNCYQIYAGLPEQLHYYSHDTVPKQSSGLILFGRAFLLLEYLQNRFLIEQISYARGLTNAQALLNTAIEMLDTTIMFWTKRDQLMMFSSNFDWFITCFGIPAAGVICIELLKQTKVGDTGTSSGVQFSRSGSIQKLTMFLGFLEWIRHTDGNYKLAGRLRTVVRRILDYVLDPPSPSVMEVGASSGKVNGIARMDDAMDVNLGLLLSMDEVDCFDWLNTVDWTQGPWMEF